MSSGNVTGLHPNCPAPLPEWSQPMRTGGLAGFLVITTYFIVTLTWWWLRREHSYLRKREFWLVVAVAMGGEAQLVLTWLAPWVGRNNLPCDLYLWLVYMIVPLGVGPVAVRLVLFRNTAMYARALVHEHRHQKRRNTRTTTRETQADSAASSAAGTSRELAQYQRTAQELLPFIRYQALRLRQHVQPRAREDSDVSDGNSDAGSQSGLAMRLYYGTTTNYGAVVLGFFVSVGFISILTRYGPSGPYGKGCSGCHIDASNLAGFISVTVLVFSVGLYTMFRLRGMSDPLNKLHELQMALLCAILASLTLVVVILDPGDLQADGLFDFQWIVTFWFVFIHTITCVLPILKTYQEAAELADSVTLPQILDSSSGAAYFERYLATEFSVENLYFVNVVKRYKEGCARDKYSPDQRRAIAKDIYRTFLKERSMLEVNVSAFQRRPVCQALHNEEADVTADLFDAPYREIMQLMTTDSFPRFKASKDFQRWKRRKVKALAPGDPQSSSFHESTVVSTYESFEDVEKGAPSFDDAEKGGGAPDAE